MNVCGPISLALRKPKALRAPKRKTQTTYGQSTGAHLKVAKARQITNRNSQQRKNRRTDTQQSHPHTPNELQALSPLLFFFSPTPFIFLSLCSQFGQRVRRQRRQRCYCCPLPRKCDKQKKFQRIFSSQLKTHIATKILAPTHTHTHTNTQTWVEHPLTTT